MKAKQTPAELLLRFAEAVGSGELRVSDLLSIDRSSLGDAWRFALARVRRGNAGADVVRVLRLLTALDPDFASGPMLLGLAAMQAGEIDVARRVMAEQAAHPEGPQSEDARALSAILEIAAR